MKELNFAFKRTIPILLGYITLGIAFGILLQQAGFGWPWALLTVLSSTPVLCSSLWSHFWAAVFHCCQSS